VVFYHKRSQSETFGYSASEETNEGLVVVGQKYFQVKYAIRVKILLCRVDFYRRRNLWETPVFTQPDKENEETLKKELKMKT